MKAKHPEAQWFQNAKLGVFIHWGIYSLKEVEASWPLLGGSQAMTIEEYEALAPQFNPLQYDPKEWAKVAKASGAKYVVLTAKHHDGYCLFDTATTDYCAAKTGPKRDLIAPYVEAVREAGLKVGLYFSPPDWYDPDFPTIPMARFQPPKPFQYDPQRWNQFHMRFVEQIRELLTNYGRIDLVWFDMPLLDADRWRSHEVKQMMLNLQPHLIVNDRLPGVGDYDTPEQSIPFNPPLDWWETCMTMNGQWAYKSGEEGYKSAEQLIRSLVTIAGKGGNLLLNVGPKSDGTWSHEAIERYLQIGEWLNHSGEAIFGTRRGPHPGCFYGPMTRKDKTVYLHVFDAPHRPLEIRGINETVVKAWILKSGHELMTRSFHGYFGYKAFTDRIEIDLPTELCDPWNTVVAVEFEREPIWPEMEPPVETRGFTS